MMTQTFPELSYTQRRCSTYNEESQTHLKLQVPLAPCIR